MLRFGTDGVRGRANTELTPEFVLLLGRAAARRLADSEWLIGWDTRLSSEMLASAFAAGVASAGRGITSLGQVPTAGVALSCLSRGLPGAMVTASHNPYQDNGIKLFGSDGVKLRDYVERDIEGLMAAGGGDRSDEVGSIRWNGVDDLADEYQKWLLGRAQALDARQLSIAIDCANGAAHKIAPQVLRVTGARVEPLGCRPDGRNINKDCGSTHLGLLQETVKANGLDLGLALDGDADRLLAVDADGGIVDGDEIIAILAHRLARRGALPRQGVVVTDWSNSGLLNGLRRAGMSVEVCDVGDKFVAEAMDRTGFALGGEQSGHIIMKDLLPVGDGISTAIELIAAVSEGGGSLREVADRGMTKVPQRTKNVFVAAPTLMVDKLGPEQDKINAELGGSGRLVLRVSGTESCVRIMAEAPDWERVSDTIRRMTGLIEAYE